MISLSANDQQLINYAYDGNLQEVRNLLRTGANVNAKNIHGVTPLFLASQHGHVQVVKELLLHDVDQQSITSAFVIASRMGREDVVEELIYDRRVDVNYHDENGETVLFMASSSGKLGVVQLLLQHEGLKVNLKNGKGQTALWVACERGNLEVVRTLLRHNKVNKSNIRSTALKMADLKGHDEVVRLLKERLARAPAGDERSSDGMSMSSASLSIKHSLSNIMEEDESTAHDRIDPTPITTDANERTAAPPHSVDEVLDKDVTDNDVLGANNHLGNKDYLESVTFTKIE
jgi:ankyrin repeat protein